MLLQVFVLRASSHFKHDMDALWWLNAGTLERERVPTPLFGGLVRCSAWVLFCMTRVYKMSPSLLSSFICSNCPD